MLYAATSILIAVTVLMGVRHEPHVRAWAMNPRTPARVAAAVTTAIATTWQAAYMAVGVSLGGVGLAFLIASAGNVA